MKVLQDEKCVSSTVQLGRRRDCAHGDRQNCDPVAIMCPTQNARPSLHCEMAVHLGLWKD
ncbi:hypothetical protein ACRRTK_017253 [Alexandromys fortis]